MYLCIYCTLNAYGISGNLLSWLTNYLSGRFQRVVLEGASSQWAPVTSGVPQGSLLGPLMFVVFINDLPDASNAINTAFYADDSKIFGAVKCVHDCEVVQTTLSNMDEWTRYNNIQFNISKCKVLTVTRKKQPVHYNYTLNNVQLTRMAEENDLGIVVTSTLSWVKHYTCKILLLTSCLLSLQMSQKIPCYPYFYSQQQI